MNDSRRWAIAVVAVCMFTTITVLHAKPKVIPDLTKGDFTGVDREQTWNLGPTGMRGWICNTWANNMELRQGRFLKDSRQILVTDIGGKTPADGLMKKDDVIIGVNGKLFAADARKSMGHAITEAEKTKSKGILALLVWRDKKSIEVKLQLPVMGDYSKTAPYDCSKSERILDNACKVLIIEPINGVFGPVTALALMATGNKEYLPKVQEYARSIKPIDPEKGVSAWQGGYTTLFLSEYYLLTNDKRILPTIRGYAVKLAQMQGMYGTFGHGGSVLTYDGRLHGSVPPYGALNNAGLIANLGIIFSAKCGVRHPEIKPAIARAARFFSYYAGKGNVPYGEHAPWILHGANGKTAMAAIMFRLLGDRPDVIHAYAMMATAGYSNREYGHTGQGLSYLWGGLGANSAGPEAMAAFVKEITWQLDLARRSDGAFTYDGGEQCGPGKKKGRDNTYFGNKNYYGLNPTASYVLTYSVPRKVLLITGRDAKQDSWLSRKEVGEAIAASKMDLEREKMSVDQLVKELSNWSPIVRSWIAEELAKRPETKALEEKLIAMLEGADANARQGACMTLGHLRSTKVLPTLIKLLNHDDYWLRYLAADAIKMTGDKARPYLSTMLEIIVAHAEPLDPINWKDPIQLAQGKLAEVVFSPALLGGGKANDDIDKKLIYRAIETISKNPSGRVRACLVNIYRNKLSEEDVVALSDDIVKSVKYMAPADTMFGTEIRMAGVDLLVKYHYKEGIPVLVELARTITGHGSERRIPVLMKQLQTYGMKAKSTIPELKALVKQFNEDVAQKRFPKWANDMRVKGVQDTIEYLEKTTDDPELKTIKGFSLK